MHEHDVSLLDASEVVAKLNEKVGLNLNTKHYYDWLEGGDHYDTFDAAVRSFLSRASYRKYDRLARLDAYLRYRLGLGPSEAGGIQFDSAVPEVTTVGQYFDSLFPEDCFVSGMPDEDLRQISDLPLDCQCGIDSKRVIDKAHEFIQICDEFCPLGRAGRRQILTMVTHQLETILFG